ncbi:MAG: hypothetical protein WED04_11245 [Promethearchaeati archaeon SRVP18_Atabeyarchaeia-1]
MSKKGADEKSDKRGGVTYLLCVAIIGYDEQNDKPVLKASYPEFDLSEGTLSGVYSLSSFTGNEPGFISLGVDEGVVMSYYTGVLEPMRCRPHCLVLFLDKPDKPERYRQLLTKLGSVVFPLLCDRDFKEFVRKLYEAASLTGELRSKRSYYA